MTSYLLLRNNKESGPYSIDDLIKLGLKAYDLVWVQGRSAAWRYPSEVEELKSFAPGNEEQPFDRFYKKQEEVKKEIPIEHAEAPKKEETAFIAPEHEKYIPKKSVFVTMPGGQKVATVKPVRTDFIPKTEEAKPAPVPTPAKKIVPIAETPVEAEVKYSQPLDDIKEMYVKTLYDRKQKIARKTFWLQSVKKVAVILVLIAAGVAAGFVIKSNGSSKENDIASKQETEPKQQPVKAVTPLVGDTNSLASSGQDIQNLPPPTGGYVNKKVAEPQSNLVDLKRAASKSINETLKKEAALSSPENNHIAVNGLVAQQNVDIDPSTGERTRKVRSANTVENREIKRNEEKTVVSSELSGQVSVTSNEYKKVAFGGIRDLQLTVSNDSKYVLDNVIVELQYIKPNELPLKTENIRFTSVGPKSTSTVRVPDTNRGIKVTYRIINIKSHQASDDGVAGN